MGTPLPDFWAFIFCSVLELRLKRTTTLSPVTSIYRRAPAINKGLITHSCERRQLRQIREECFGIFQNKLNLLHPLGMTKET